MDLRYSESDERFRAELRAWLEDAVPAHGPAPPMHDWEARRAYDAGWQRKLFDAGYAGINWPKEYGGRDASGTEQLVYYEEVSRAGAPYIGVNFVGMLHGGPTIVAEGTPEQKAVHLPRILRGEEIWCQGFSEPDAGSDLASLKTRAVRDGDHYVVSGHKIWTSFAQVADVCELLVRTDPDAPKHRGISWLAMPMDLPGIEIRPLPTLAGESEFSEVFLEDVRVPVEHRVGDENDGWRVTNVTLRFERGTAFASEMINLQQFARELVRTAKRVTRDDAPAWDDRALRREVGHLVAELDALWAMVKLSVSKTSQTGVPGVEGSAIKLYYTELAQRAGELGMRVLGRAALSREDVDGLPARKILGKAMQSLSLTIAAGSSQIQRNIIAERILGMPKEPRASAPQARAASRRRAESGLMDFRVDEDQEALQEGIRSFCDGRVGFDQLPDLEKSGGFDRGLWSELADMGVFALRRPESEGGVGLGNAEAVLVFAELGRRVVPGPLAWSHLAAGRVDGAASGETVVGGLDLVGQAGPTLVEHLEHLDALLLLRADGVYRVDPKRLSGEEIATPLDPLTPLHHVAELPAGDRIGDAADAARVRLEGAALVAGQLFGIAEMTRELAVEYAGTREQFDRPIGSFQAIKHILADMFVRQEVARAAAYAAGATLDQPDVGDPARAVASAKVDAGEAAMKNARACIQVYGGMGYTWEMPPHYYLKRTWVLETCFGTSDEHAERLGDLLDAAS